MLNNIKNKFIGVLYNMYNNFSCFFYYLINEN